ncbi:MAG: hypothetical protein OSJ39_00135 [Clostridia bacterium]|nr:hypothetical protein [Clostridia bacterium]
MENKKPFFKRVHFYLAAVAFVFTIVALALYGGNCASEFNGGKVSAAVVGWDIVAIISLAAAIAGDVLEFFFDKDTLVEKICEYLRLFAYLAFVSLIVSFFMGILDEYSLLGTILYPIVSGTVGDPVDGTLAASYFVGLGFTFVSLVLSIVSALLHKREARLALAPAKEEAQA